MCIASLVWALKDVWNWLSYMKCWNVFMDGEIEAQRYRGQLEIKHHFPWYQSLRESGAKTTES